jgi:hypothetical protein
MPKIPKIVFLFPAFFAFLIFCVMVLALLFAVGILPGAGTTIAGGTSATQTASANQTATQSKATAQNSAAPASASQTPNLGDGTARLTQAQGKQDVSGTNVSIKDGASVNGMQAGTLQGILNDAQACGCQMVITSGTDSHAGVSSDHNLGLAADIRSNPQLDMWARSLPGGVDSNGNKWSYESTGQHNSNGSVATGNHWHVKCVGSCTVPTS